MITTTARRNGLTAALVAGALVLAGCGNDTDVAGHGSMTGSTAPSAGASAGTQDAFNDADVSFAAGMIAHHQQALAMAQLADDRAADPRVRDLAERIEAAQGPEIEILRGWLDQWGAEPMDGMGHDGTGRGGMGHDGMGHGAGGMMSEQDMHALMAATGAEFDRLFLEQMVVHHTGAVRMAETQLAEGENADAMALADAIRDSQAAEIAEMEQLLTDLGG
ncbi:DUF305 domain-containing protein [Blastococcus sp. SYSU DS0552]